MKKLFTTISVALLSIMAAAIPANKGQWRMLTLSDGSRVKAELKGDEFMHYWQTEDGRQFVRISQTDKEVFRPADISAMQSVAKARFWQRGLAQRAKTRNVGDSKAYLGKKKGLIILVQFSDLKFQAAHTKEFYQLIANEPNFQDGDFRGSVHDYFYDQSNGQFDLEFDIAGPYTLSNNYQYYGQNEDDVSGNDKNPGKMVVEAVEKAALEFDFTQYDWDGDNEVDQVFVLYAGQGEANGGNANTIWPHEWYLQYAVGSAMSINNMRVDTYACGSELGASELITSGIGTICHEFTHCLGLPDMYDTSDSGSNYGMGSWDVMCSGSYNGNGFSPAGFTSYEKTWCGWLTPTELTTDTTVSHLMPLSEGGGAYIVYNDNYRDEYYLLECRRQSGWDSSVGGNGLLVIHVDYDSNIWRYNTVNGNGYYYDSNDGIQKNDHQRCSIIPGDNAQSTNNESSDPFPFNKRNYLSNVSSPAAVTFHPNTDGSFLMNKALRDIERHEDGSVSFRFEAVDTQTEPVFEGVLFEEHFDACDGTGGNDDTWTGGTGVFMPENVGWDYDSKNAVAGGGYRCARFGTRVAKGSVSLPKVFVGQSSTLSFRAAPWSSETTNITVSILGNAETTVSPRVFTLSPNKWTDCEATITGQGDITIRLTPSNNRFFIDDIKVEANNNQSAIEVVEQLPPANSSHNIYTIDGRRLDGSLPTLKHGVYIINKKKVIK